MGSSLLVQQPIDPLTYQPSRFPGAVPTPFQEAGLIEQFLKAISHFHDLIVSDMTVFISKLQNHVFSIVTPDSDLDQANILLNNILDCQEVFDKALKSPLAGQQHLVEAAQQALKYTENEVSFIFDELSRKDAPQQVRHGGMENPGKHCYMIAPLQAIGATSYSRDWTAALDSDGIQDQIRTMVSQVKEGMTIPVAAVSKFLSALFDPARKDCFNPLPAERNLQQDADEFTTYLLDQIGLSLKMTPYILQNGNYQDAPDVNDTMYRLPLPDSHLPVPFQTLLTKRPSSFNGMPCEEETVFMSAPALLPIQLKRFHDVGSKVKTIVELPKDGIVHISVQEDIHLIPKPYKLQSFVVHLGEEQDSGHYVTYRKKDHLWLRCDDEKVREASEGEVMRMGRHAYLLFFDPA